MSNLFSTRDTKPSRAYDLEELAREAVGSIKFDVARADDILGDWAPLDGALRAVTAHEGSALEIAARSILGSSPDFTVFSAALQMGVVGTGSERTGRYRPDLVAINHASRVLIIAEFKRCGGNHPTIRLNGLASKLERAAGNARDVLASHAKSFDSVKLAIVDIAGQDSRPLTVNLEQFEEIVGAPGFAQSMALFRAAYSRHCRPLIAALAHEIFGSTQGQPAADPRQNEPDRLQKGLNIEFCRAPRKTFGGM